MIFITLEGIAEITSLVILYFIISKLVRKYSKHKQLAPFTHGVTYLYQNIIDLSAPSLVALPLTLIGLTYNIN